MEQKGIEESLRNQGKGNRSGSVVLKLTQYTGGKEYLKRAGL